MSAPSALHEERVRTLETVAVLAGATVPTSIGAECLPDLARATPDGSVLLVADAKATETPGCDATARRLRRYVRAVRPLVEGGVAVRIAVCHGDGARSGDWQRTLAELAASAGLATQRPATCAFDRETFVTWADLRRRDD